MINKIRDNEVKTVLFGKFVPGVFGVIPILSGVIQVKPLKFAITNFFTTLAAVGTLFYGIKFLEGFLGEIIWYIIGIAITVYITFIFIQKRKKKN